MFKKNKCEKCNNNIKEGYDFCPYCGNSLISNSEGDWGMLGKSDFVSPTNEIKGFPTGLNMIFNNLMKTLYSQFNELEKNPQQDSQKHRGNGISISISTSNGKQPEIKVNSFGNERNNESIKKQIKTPSINLSKNLRKFSTLQKVDPKTNVRRFSDKVIYEIEMPGVKSMQDISIARLENSIEIKAVSKDKAYSKIIPINLPITRYGLSEGKLILELADRNQ